jgi:hypothetical protein
MPVLINLQGVNLNATATGTLVGFVTAAVGEPATLLLVGSGLLGLAIHGRKRRSD